MDDSNTDALLPLAARTLTGHARRRFQAEVAHALCAGRPRLAERRFGWGRETVRVGLRERASGIRCVENFAARGRSRTEDPNPRLAADIRELVEPDTYVDPELKSNRRYTDLAAREVRERLRAKGYAADALPSERTPRDILNRMGYRLARIRKGRPLKEVPETDAIFENVRSARAEAEADPGTLEISMDTKAKVNEGEYVRGGKNPDGVGRVVGDRVGPRPATSAEVDAVGGPDGSDGCADTPVR